MEKRSKWANKKSPRQREDRAPDIIPEYKFKPGEEIEITKPKTINKVLEKGQSGSIFVYLFTLIKGEDPNKSLHVFYQKYARYKECFTNAQLSEKLMRRGEDIYNKEKLKDVYKDKSYIRG